MLCIWKVCRPGLGAEKPLPQSVSETATVCAAAGLLSLKATIRPATRAGTATAAAGSTHTGRAREGPPDSVAAGCGSPGSDCASAAARVSGSGRGSACGWGFGCAAGTAEPRTKSVMTIAR